MLDESVSSGVVPVVAVDAPSASSDWHECSMLALERLPLPYPLLVVLVTLFVAGEQILEHVTANPAHQYPPNEVVRQFLVIPVLCLYILVYLGLLKRRTVAGLEKLRPAVKIGDQEYWQYAKRMLNANPRYEVALFVVSVVVNYLLFIVARVNPQMRTDGGIPDSVLLDATFMAVYVLLGWLLLTLVYTSIRFAQGLGGLARKSLEVNVFDPGNLVPFGELNLLPSLAVVGLVLIPLGFLGPPEHAGFILIGLSVISLGALFVPLLGVHRQMNTARDQALDQIYAQLMDGHRKFMECTSCVEHEALDSLVKRTTLLANLRELVLKSPAWPFRNFAALLRATIAVASPFLIYFLQKLMDVFVLPRFRP